MCSQTEATIRTTEQCLQTCNGALRYKSGPQNTYFCSEINREGVFSPYDSARLFFGKTHKKKHPLEEFKDMTIACRDTHAASLVSQHFLVS